MNARQHAREADKSMAGARVADQLASTALAEHRYEQGVQHAANRDAAIRLGQAHALTALALERTIGPMNDPTTIE